MEQCVRIGLPLGADLIMDNSKALGLAYGKEILFAVDPHRGPRIVREGCLEEAE